MYGSSIVKVARRQWALVVTLVVLLVVISGISRLHGMFGSHNETSREATDSLQNADYNPKRVQLEVFGSPGATATINFLDENAQPVRVDDVMLPWSHELVTTDSTLFADLRAQGDSSPITCRITVNGSVKDERSTAAMNGYIACLDKTA